MNILVQKFGGTSVATPESREAVYRKVEKAKAEGYSVVVVVSAMGRTGAPYATDTLLDLVRLDCPKSQKRETDLIFSCGEVIAGVVITTNLQQRGHKAVYLTGGQAGIVTTGNHGEACILKIKTERIRSLLAGGNIVVVAGGQGATETGEVTILGRGGSDTTGTALGVALDAKAIEIYTDVEGIFTADPRVVPEARLIEEISYADCCRLAYQGAKVIHPRAVEIASRKPSIPFYVRSTFSDRPGTLISNPSCNLEGGTELPAQDNEVGVAATNGFTMFCADTSPALKFAVLEKTDRVGATVHDLHPELGRLLLVVDGERADEVAEILATSGIKAKRIDDVTRVSLVGMQLTVSPRAMASFLGKLVQAKIPVLAILSQAEVLSAWVPGHEAGSAMKAVHSLLMSAPKEASA